MATRVGSNLVDRLWRPIDDLLVFTGEATLILWEAVTRLLRRPIEFQEVIGQMAFMGVASVPIVALTGFFSGAVLSLYLTKFLLQYGATQFVGATVGLSVTREVAPVITGIMVAARCGSAMAAQIATMKVTDQLDALKMLSVNPSNYLVIPRILAAITMLPILAMVSMYSGVGGGWLVAMWRGVPSGTVAQSIQQFVVPWDFWGGMLKTPIFGLIIALVACQQGMRTTDGAVGVGKATTNAVVISMVLIYTANFFLAQIFFG